MNQEQANRYFFFARLFRETPTPELLRQLGWPPTQADEIAIEYARLFVVPGKESVQPYESVYCDTLSIDTSTACSPYFQAEPQIQGLTGYLNGPSANSVRRAYQYAGLDLGVDAHPLPDHLAVELEFMGRLVECGEFERAKTFYTEHLGRWAFRCLGEIEKKSGLEFYRIVAREAAAFLEQEQAVTNVTDKNRPSGYTMA